MWELLLPGATTVRFPRPTVRGVSTSDFVYRYNQMFPIMHHFQQPTYHQDMRLYCFPFLFSGEEGFRAWLVQAALWPEAVFPGQANIPPLCPASLRRLLPAPQSPSIFLGEMGKVLLAILLPID